jgi:hypothetical protein
MARVAADVAKAPAPVAAILCPTVWGVRNIVHSGLLATLRARGLRAHAIVGASGGRPLIDIGATGDCSPLLEAPTVRSTRGKPTLEALLRASFCRRHQISSYAIFNRWLRRDSTTWQRLRNAAVDALSVAGSAAPAIRWQVANLERIARRTRDFTHVRAQLAELRPALLVSTACIAGEEHPYLLVARELGIRTLGCILSFDNLTSRTVLPVFDDYAVWNERMREQVLAFYPDRDPTRVHITGTPQFDYHVRPEYRESRVATAHRLGLEPDEPYVLYAANSAFFTPSEPELVAELARRYAAVPELARHRIVVRLHPLDDYGRWDSLARGGSRIVVSRPWDSMAGVFGPDDQVRLVSSLLHADVCINMASTMSLDAAALDTPVICIAFAGQRHGEEDRFCRDVYRSEHYRHIVASGGVRLARDIDTIVTETTAYVRDRTRDRAGRQALVELEIGAVDGRAGERIIALIERLSHEARA